MFNLLRTPYAFHHDPKHPHHHDGQGTVIESKVTGNDEEVTVVFPGEGIKRLAASFANLVVID